MVTSIYFATRSVACDETYHQCLIAGLSSMGAVLSAFATAASAAIPIILNAIRNSKVQESPTLTSILQHHRRTESPENDARCRIQQLEREKKEQSEKAEREKEAALKAIRRTNEEVKANEKVMEEMMEAQKTVETKWKKGVHPVEWPSREQYDMVKQRLYQDGKFHLAIAGKSERASHHSLTPFEVYGMTRKDLLPLTSSKAPPMLLHTLTLILPTFYLVRHSRFGNDQLP